MTTPARRRPRAFTTLEVTAACAVITILLAVVAAQFAPTVSETVDRTGPALLSAAVLDARASAETTHFAYDTTGTTTVDQMRTAATARTSAGGQVTYTAGPSAAPGAGHMDLQVSVHVASPTQVGLAVTTSADGGGSHCVMAVDSLRDGTQFAVLDPADGGGTNRCSGAVAIACASTWDALPGSGAYSDPFRLEPGTACVR